MTLLMDNLVILFRGKEENFITTVVIDGTAISFIDASGLSSLENVIGIEIYTLKL